MKKMHIVEHSPSPQGNKGFSLLEILVSSIILSVGLLGLASLHYEGLKSGSESLTKAMAGMLTEDLIDRMHANAEGVRNGNYDGLAQTISAPNVNCLGGIEDAIASTTSSSTTTANTTGTSIALPAADVSKTATRTFSNSTCTPPEMAQQDIFEWRSQLGKILPNATVNLCRTNNPGTNGSALNCSGTGNIYVLSISWTNRKGKVIERRTSFVP